MQSVIVVASLVSELVGGQNDPSPLVLNVTENTLVLLRKYISIRRDIKNCEKVSF